MRRNSKEIRSSLLRSWLGARREDRRERDSAIIERRPDYEPVTFVMDREARQTNSFKYLSNYFTKLRISHLACWLVKGKPSKLCVVLAYFLPHNKPGTWIFSISSFHITSLISWYAEIRRLRMTPVSPHRPHDLPQVRRRIWGQASQFSVRGCAVRQTLGDTNPVKNRLFYEDL